MNVSKVVGGARSCNGAGLSPMIRALGCRNDRSSACDLLLPNEALPSWGTPRGVIAASGMVWSCMWRRGTVSIGDLPAVDDAQ